MKKVFDKDQNVLTINEIAISEDDMAQGLLFKQIIYDGSNNKWIGTVSSGIHLALLSDLNTFETKVVKLKVAKC
ncbi:hypothetical protein [Confluentibacter sediminis]|uniref:hypothetical protein n=1 Tax=Confluentibacter sediminis TaxID=2219045 RepID=UPI000DADE19D|nr:hypothetical protein [Confluentibacter sediminis]